MRLSTTFKWVGLALVGILIAAAVAVAASRLASQQIGLASEPISAGNTLAPQTAAPAQPPEGGKSPSRTPTTGVPTTPPPEPPVTTTSTAEPHGGGDEHSGDDHDADD